MASKRRIWIYPLAIISVLLILTNSCKKSSTLPPQETITDADGNVYHTITIGSQVWTVENLKTTKFTNGDPIPIVTDTTAWENLTSGAYCDHHGDSIFAETYGKLYNWYAVSDARKITPFGWHVATDAEWATMVTYLGGLTVAGGHLKESGLVHWPNPNIGADNTSGFTALPGGYRNDLGEFNPLASGYWWTSTWNGVDGAWSWNMSYLSAGLVRADAAWKYGYSVRLMKD